MSCNFHVRQALLKTAAKKRFEKILLMKEQFRLYLEPEVEYSHTAPFVEKNTRTW
jgi:hypothetical protein